ncbi:MAG: type I-F CRISPR-associated endoribonuclease Cas6/Csy4 [Methylococcaceae bacterium]
MKYYLDITLLPNAEANLGFLWQKVYQQIHLALVENKIAKNESAIAVSFPNYKDKEFPLGDKVRLFADEEKLLKQLNIEKWLSRLSDYTHLKPIKTVPETVNQFARFKRKQFKSNLLKEAKRRAEYKNESLDTALEHFKHYETKNSLPYINMTSLSMDKGSPAISNRHFKLIIDREILEEPEQGAFDCYGLSKTASIPWF